MYSVSDQQTISVIKGTLMSLYLVPFYMEKCPYNLRWTNGDLRVPPWVDLDVLRQSHGTLIIKGPVCFRPLKPYIACFSKCIVLVLKY